MGDKSEMMPGERYSLDRIARGIDEWLARGGGWRHPDEAYLDVLKGIKAELLEIRFCLRDLKDISEAETGVIAFESDIDLDKEEDETADKD